MSTYYFIDYDDFNGLVQFKKTFCVLFLADWQKRQNRDFVSSIVPQFQAKSFVFFILLLKNDSQLEEYILNRTDIRKLPSFSIFSNGDLINTIYQESFQNIVHKIPSEMKFNLSSLFNLKSGTDSLKILFLESNISKIGRVFISGDKSGSGKSSLCLGILYSLIKRGINPNSLAYIKPVTQCEKKQPVTKFCEKMNIRHKTDPGPVVFYQGFTRAFLNNETDSSEDLIQQVLNEVEFINFSKKFLIVDGVGYPSVGSICGISNANVAKSLNCPVLIVGKPGVGDAIDSYNLNSSFFELHGARVLGCIFNKFPTEGYYGINECINPIRQYFEQYKREQSIYGFIPDKKMDNVIKTSSFIINGVDINKSIIESFDDVSKDPLILMETFFQNIDIDKLIHDCWLHKLLNGDSDIEIFNQPPLSQPTKVIRPAKLLNPDLLSSNSSLFQTRTKRSREDVEKDARKKGSSGG